MSTPSKSAGTGQIELSKELEELPLTTLFLIGLSTVVHAKKRSMSQSNSSLLDSIVVFSLSKQAARR